MSVLRDRQSHVKTKRKTFSGGRIFRINSQMMAVLLELTGGKGEKKYRRQHGVKISADHVKPYMSVEEL